jgi:hypothetical protein
VLSGGGGTSTSATPVTATISNRTTTRG